MHADCFGSADVCTGVCIDMSIDLRIDMRMETVWLVQPSVVHQVVGVEAEGVLDTCMRKHIYCLCACPHKPLDYTRVFTAHSLHQ